MVNCQAQNLNSPNCYSSFSVLLHIPAFIMKNIPINSLTLNKDKKQIFLCRRITQKLRIIKVTKAYAIPKTSFIDTVHRFDDGNMHRLKRYEGL